MIIIIAILLFLILFAVWPEAAVWLAGIGVAACVVIGIVLAISMLAH